MRCTGGPRGATPEYERVPPAQRYLEPVGNAAPLVRLASSLVDALFRFVSRQLGSMTVQRYSQPQVIGTKYQ